MNDKSNNKEEKAPAKRPVPPQLVGKNWQPGQSGNPTGRAKGLISYAKALRLAAEKIAAEEGLDNPEEVYIDVLAAGLKKARAGSFKFNESVLDRMYGAVSKKEEAKGNQTNVFVLPESRRDEIYKIASIHNDQPESDRLIGERNEGGEAGGV